jgi:hypothetical protein
MSELALVDIFINGCRDSQYAHDQKKWPWLANITFEHNLIEIIDVQGENRQTKKVNLDCPVTHTNFPKKLLRNFLITLQ